jgi:NADH-quinone oxidoreductase subunit G
VSDLGTVTLTIDGTTVTVPKGTNVLEAARTIGIDISAFCYHPGLSIAACCRQCLVSIEKNPKLQPSCQSTAADGMVVKTTDPQSTLARKQMLEFTLVNHPIDCPICDKAGECTLQKLYFEHDNADSRVDTPKVHKAKVVDVGPHIVLDQERCILCTRCIRVCDEVAHSHQLEMANRGDHEILTTAPGQQLDNPYSLNTVDVCPVGALTAKDFRFTMRAWELNSTPSICNGCSTGCAIELHHKNERAWRIVPRHDPDTNGYWMCDEGRFTYHDLRDDRLAGALVDGLPAGWERSLKAAAAAIQGVPGRQVAVVLSAIHSNEDNYALAKLAQAWNAGTVAIALRPPVPGRADDILRDADVNPNLAGAVAIAKALGIDALDSAKLTAALAGGEVKVLVTLGDVLGVDAASISALGEGVSVVALAAHERGFVKKAKVALPVAAWAEVSATVTNRKGKVGRMHAAFPPPGQAVPAWEAVVKLATATGAKLVWSTSRDVFREMVDKVPAFAGASWGREVRPIQLRFAASRG